MIIEILKALLEGIVEGITEWLPISSTGHMILIDEFVKLQVSDQFLALFLVVIQIGATSSTPSASRRRRRSAKAPGGCGAWSSSGAFQRRCSDSRSTIG